ncbi:(Fe-S)-binding protein [Pseudodesulfovibrio sp. JC047]|uniref:(Fe-S)-binding protein n=1 Tax=Pseudodesulfovibrio sp. JC047 TaxID=2683199 RepID=UPI0013D8463C|nr:(Fe-S)-binding protein [Pseudodesulfovibrio sp. JC047]NDV18206.1 (Fe-S)-binding protein [Pseudodesulfovibrio sp. JC047]
MSSSNTSGIVNYFGTCLVDMCYPEYGMAGIKLLRREGLDVVYPEDQSCCGQPAYNSGYMDQTRKVALHQVEVFKDNEHPIIVPSGSCAAMMRYHYPRLFEGRPEYGMVCRFSKRIHELTQYLNATLKVQYEDKGAPKRVTWHSSCHAEREMHCVEDSKALLEQLENVTLVPLENEHECCGFGGTFSVKEPELSEAMVRDKAMYIEKTGVDLFIVGDCGCLMNIAGHLKKKNSPVKGVHIADFIWERING